MKFVWAAAFVTAALVQAHAVVDWRSPDLCRDMEKAMCMPGAVFDGTGTASNTDTEDDAYNRNSEAFRVTALARVSGEFERELTGNPAFLETAMSTWPQPPIRGCEPGGDRSICRRELAAKIAEYVIDEAIRGYYGDAPNPRRSNSENSLGGVPRRDFSLERFERLIQNPVYRAMVTRMNRDLFFASNQEDTAKRIERIRPWVQGKLIQLVQRSGLDQSQKRVMIDRIEKIRFDLVAGCRAQSGPVTLTSYLSDNAGYIPHENAFTICPGTFTASTSDFGLLYTIGHELGHALDFCNLHVPVGPRGTRNYSAGLPPYTDQLNRERGEEQYALRRLLKCLRDRDSVEARPADETSIDRPIWPQAVVLRTPKPVQRQRYPTYCRTAERDQASEAISDWFGAEIMTAYIQEHYDLSQEQYRKGVANIYRTSCPPGNGRDEGSGVHPSISRRVNRIILTHPELRKRMGCERVPTPARYCSLDATDTVPVRRTDAPARANE